MQKILLLAIAVIFFSCKKTVIEKIDADSFRISILPVKTERFNTFKITGTLDIRKASGEVEYGLLVGKTINPIFENAVKYSINKSNTSVDFNYEVAGLDTGAAYYARAYAIRDNLIEYSANQLIGKISPRITISETAFNYGKPFLLNINLGKLNPADVKVFLNETEIEVSTFTTSADASTILVKVGKQIIPGPYTLRVAIGKLNISYHKQLTLFEGTWEQLDNLPADNGGRIGYNDYFMNGNWIYVYRLTAFSVFDEAQFYKYNFQTKEKVILKPYESTLRYQQPAILQQGSLIHFITGSRIGLEATKNHYIYNLNTDSWTREADFPGEARKEAISIISGNKLFIGLGRSPFFQNTMSDHYNRDMWSYDLTTKIWKKMSDFPLAEGRLLSGTFSIGTKLYVVAGGAFNLNSGTGAVPTKQTWCYDTVTDQWTKKSDYPGKGEISFVNFSIGNFGYVGFGESLIYSSMRIIDNHFYRYDPAADRWMEVSGIENGITKSMIGSNGTNGFAGGGISMLNSDNRSLYRFTP